MAAPAFYAVQTTTTVGTGTLTLIAPAANHRSFQAAAGNTSIVVCYRIDYSGGHEWGVGTFDGGSPGTLSRTTIIASSNGGSAVSLPAGTATVFLCWMPGARGRFTGTGSDSITVAYTGGVYVWTGSSDGTATLAAVAGFPEGGEEILFINRGTAVLTLDGNGSETINGVATLKLGPGGWAAISRRGSAWDARGKSSLTTVFTGSGTWTKNPLTQHVQVFMAGGGGGGGGGTTVASSGSGGGGGGAGGMARSNPMAASDITATVAVTVGAAGAGGAAGANGTSGGATSFGSYAAAYGGGGGGVGVSGAISYGGNSAGSNGSAGASTSSAIGSTAFFGANGGAGTSGALPVVGSNIVLGSSGGGGGATGAGNAGGSLLAGPSGGGSGGGLNSGTAQTGGAGGTAGINAGGTGGTTGGGAGVAGTSYTAWPIGAVGAGGGGGGGHGSGTGGAGGAGGLPGGGGGGGSGTTAGGAGGAGAAGRVIVMEW